MPGKGRPPQAIPSPFSRHIITCYVRYQGSKHTVIYILVQTIISVQAKLEVIRRKHIVHLTGFGAYSSTCYKGTDNCAGTMGVDQLPSSTVRLLTLDNASNDKRPSRHIAALTYHELVQKYIGSTWIISIVSCRLLTRFRHITSLLLAMFLWTPVCQTSAANWPPRHIWKEILSTLCRESIMKKLRAVFKNITSK